MDGERRVKFSVAQVHFNQCLPNQTSLQFTHRVSANGTMRRTIPTSIGVPTRLRRAYYGGPWELPDPPGFIAFIADLQPGLHQTKLQTRTPVHHAGQIGGLKRQPPHVQVLACMFGPSTSMHWLYAPESLYTYHTLNWCSSCRQGC